MRKENQGIRDAGQSSLPRKGPSPRPGNLTGYLIFSLFIFRFLLSRVGAYCIRPTNDPIGAILSIYGWVFLSLRDTCRAYAIRPYPTGRRYFYRDCHQIFSGIHPFLVLIQEKDAKRKSRHQGCRPIWPGTGRGRQGYRGIWPRIRPSRF